jgi:hypothetical protein
MHPLRAALAAAALALALTAARASPVPLALGVHHLVDGALLASTNNTYFALGALAKDTDHPLVVPEHPWEQALHFYTSLVALDGGFILYYGCSDEVLFFNPIPLCVATSPDGRAWTKPLLNIHPYTANGTLPPVPTNIVFITEPNTFSLHAFVDARAGASAAARVVLAYESETGGARFVRAATSADGLVFSPAAADPGAAAPVPDAELQLVKPVFVSKTNRATLEERARIEKEEKEEEKFKAQRAEQRKKETRKMVAEELQKEKQAALDRQMRQKREDTDEEGNEEEEYDK